MAWRMGVVATAILLLGVTGAWAAQEDWEPDLKWQLDDEQNCKLSYLTNVIERRVDDALVVFARAHCDDGRAFDAVREDEFAFFTLAPCQLDIRSC